MPESIVSRLVILESFNLAESRLRLRFSPAFFEVDHKDPILRIEVELTAEIDKAEQKISHIKQELCADIEVDDTSVSIWIEDLDSPIQFLGSVTWKYEEYATSDYIEAINDGKLYQDRQKDEIIQLKQTIDRALRFIDRTIDRIEKRQDLTHSRSANDTKQIRLLRGVRRHLVDD